MKHEQPFTHKKKILFTFAIIILAIVLYIGIFFQSGDKSGTPKAELKKSYEINYNYKDAKIRLPYNLLFGELSYSEWLEKEKSNLLSVLKISTNILPKPKWHKTGTFEKGNIEIKPHTQISKEFPIMASFCTPLKKSKDSSSYSRT